MQPPKIPQISGVNFQSKTSFIALYLAANVLNLGDAISTIRDVSSGFHEENLLLSFLGSAISFDYAVVLVKIMFVFASTLLLVLSLRTKSVKDKKISVLTMFAMIAICVFAVINNVILI